MPTLERKNHVPLYYQLKELLKLQISTSSPHMALPSEAELGAQFRVSRATVRRALTELVREGLVYREHGRGTFVCEPRVQPQHLSKLTSFSEEIRRRGQRPGGLLLVSELARGSQAIREQLRLTDEEQVIHFERLRTASAVPIAYENIYLLYPLATNVYKRAGEIAEGSLYSIMSSEGLEPHIAEQTFRADAATNREAEILCIAQGMVGIRLTSLIFNETGIPIEYAEAFFPASGHYEFHVILRTARERRKSL